MLPAVAPAKREASGFSRCLPLMAEGGGGGGGDVKGVVVAMVGSRLNVR